MTTISYIDNITEIVKDINSVGDDFNSNDTQMNLVRQLRYIGINYIAYIYIFIIGILAGLACVKIYYMCIRHKLNVKEDLDNLVNLEHNIVSIVNEFVDAEQAQEI